ncbi:MAG: hypothetical protein IJ438_10555 [Clostridia bacterium]|nr:hypothetical protein [Clostridia bacterium]
MTEPIVPVIQLPLTALTAPLPQRPAPEETVPSDPNALCEWLEPLISAAIARKARQRRYT